MGDSHLSHDTHLTTQPHREIKTASSTGLANLKTVIMLTFVYFVEIINFSYYIGCAQVNSPGPIYTEKHTHNCIVHSHEDSIF